MRKFLRIKVIIKVQTVYEQDVGIHDFLSPVDQVKGFNLNQYDQVSNHVKTSQDHSGAEMRVQETCYNTIYILKN